MEARATRPELRALSLEQLGSELASLGPDIKPFRARQVFAWVHGRGVTDVEAMSDLPRDLRGRLARHFQLRPPRLESELSAEDGTRKLRLRLTDGAAVETVLIPEEGKVTLCLSSQVGCGLGCRFCATARMGLHRNLTVGEIVDQVYQARALLPSGTRLSNLVFMGMGEPLHNLPNLLPAVRILCSDLGANLSPRRITLSTAGVVPGIDELGRRWPQLGLAVSLNATTDETRASLMPIARRYPLAELLAALRRYPLPRRRRLTVEYVLIRGVNDSLADARRIPALLDRIRAKVNLIAFNPDDKEQDLARPLPEQVEAFAEELRRRDLTTHVRRSRGADIAAACGQLACRTESDEGR